MCTHKCKVRAQTDTITLKGGVNMKRDKHLGIRMDSQLHKKLVYIAEYEVSACLTSMVPSLSILKLTPLASSVT